MRLGFAGTPQFAIPALDALLRSRHGVVAVFTQPDRPAGRGQTLHVSAVKQYALARGIDVHQPANFKTADAAAALCGLNLDVLVVVAYGLILPAAALALPRFGCINIHASMLPRWRGAAPIQRALLAGDASTGVTIMHMDAGLDTGPKLAAREVPIGERDTAGTLHDRLANLGGELLLEALEALANGSAHPQPQPPIGVTYAEKINKAEALIDWRDGAIRVLRRVRAFNPWPIAETTLEGAQLRVWDAELAPGATTGPAIAAAAGAAPSESTTPGTVIAASSDGIDVACGRGELRILRLQLAGRKTLTAREFIKARPLVGARLISS